MGSVAMPLAKLVEVAHQTNVSHVRTIIKGWIRYLENAIVKINFIWDLMMNAMLASQIVSDALLLINMIVQDVILNKNTEL